MLDRVLIPFFLLLVLPDAYLYFAYLRNWLEQRKKHSSDSESDGFPSDYSSSVSDEKAQKDTFSRLKAAFTWKNLRQSTFFSIPTLILLLPTIFLFFYFLIVYGTDDMRANHQASVGLFVFIFLLITVPKMLFTIADCIGIAIARWKPSVRRYLRIFAMTLSLCAIIILCYGFFKGRSRFMVHQQVFYFSNLPEEFDGYRIALFSDIHLGTFNDGHEKDVETIVNLINNQQCDVILFAGDLVNYETKEALPYESTLGTLKAHDGVYAILGNHDYSNYIRQPEAERNRDLKALHQLESKLNWKILMNANHVIRRGNDSIAIIGSENQGLPPWPTRGDLKAASKGLQDVYSTDSTLAHTFSVLLTHDPTHWRRNVLPETNIDLTLSGHTHGGQFKIFGWSPVAHRYSEWSGAYSEGSQIICVSDGIGTIFFPFRFGAWPEVNVITLRKN